MYSIMHRTIISCIILSFPLAAIDNPHFYRATNMFLEPRIEHNFFTTLDTTFGSGTTDKGRNKHGATVPLFDIYGTHRIPQSNSIVSIDATFKIQELNLFYIQNFATGFFLQFHMPIRNIHIKNIVLTDLISHNPIKIRTLEPTLRNNNISLQPFNETGTGDLTCMLGFTHNYQKTTTLDFIDGTIAAGMLAPTGKKKNINQIFSLPLGYNGHWAVPVSGRLSLGMYGWITVGAAVNAIFFVKNEQKMRLKTTPDESSLIQLSLDKVTVHKGTVWDAGAFLKADHFMYGLSLTAAYSCAGEQKTVLTPTHPSPFDFTIINTDQKLKNWYMHTMHFLAEYDFAQQDSKTGLRIGFFYNYQFGGIRVFNTNVIGGSFGIDIGWYL